MRADATGNVSNHNGTVYLLAAGMLDPTTTVMAIWPAPMIYAGPTEVSPPPPSTTITRVLCLTSSGEPHTARCRATTTCGCPKSIHDELWLTGRSCMVMAGDFPRQVPPQCRCRLLRGGP